LTQERKVGRLQKVSPRSTLQSAALRRVNQTGNWRAWNKIVPSFGDNSPTNTTYKDYDLIIIPQMSTGTDNLVLNFDIMSFDVNKDLSSWLLLDNLEIEEILIGP